MSKQPFIHYSSSETNKLNSAQLSSHNCFCFVVLEGGDDELSNGFLRQVQANDKLRKAVVVASRSREKLICLVVSLESEHKSNCEKLGFNVLNHVLLTMVSS
jgi:hypothetical protein